MPVSMSKEEVELTLLRLEEFNDNNLRDGYDRVIERIVNYTLANLDDFMECYNEEDVDMFGDKS